MQGRIPHSAARCCSWAKIRSALIHWNSTRQRVRLKDHWDYNIWLRFYLFIFSLFVPPQEPHKKHDELFHGLLQAFHETEEARIPRTNEGKGVVWMDPLRGDLGFRGQRACFRPCLSYKARGASSHHRPSDHVLLAQTGRISTRESWDGGAGGRLHAVPIFRSYCVTTQRFFFFFFHAARESRRSKNGHLHADFQGHWVNAA